MHPSSQTLLEDVLTYIFCIIESWDCFVEGYGEHNKTLVKRKNLWSISQVCRHWRYTALNCHRLWSRIFFHDEHLLISDPEEIVRQQFERSASHPLDLSVRLGILPMTVTSAEPKISIIHRTIALIVASSERWCSLYLHVPPNTVSLFGAIKGRIPRLEVLTVLISRPGAPGSDYDSTIFSIAPSLREAALKSNDSLNLTLPIQHLRILYTHLGIATHNILPHARRLHSLYVSGPMKNAPMSLITLPTLERLRLTAEAATFARLLVCPGLTSLTYEINEHFVGNNERTTALRQFQCQSRFNLKSMQVYYQDRLMKDGVAFPFEWACTDSIESLMLIRVHALSWVAQVAKAWEIRVFKYLTLESGSLVAHAMPLLSAFTLSTVSEGDEAWTEALVQMVRSRPRLKSLCIRYGRGREKYLDMLSFKAFSEEF